MAKVLPEKPRLPAAIQRRHAPPRNRYENYRPCLRWEFGFSCGYCGLHEADFTEMGADGLGLMWIEHLVTKKAGADKINDYDNVVYCCRLCNRARGTRPRTSPSGARLLNPAEDSWEDNFCYSADVLLARHDAGPDAVYTAESYDMEDARKTRARERRRRRLQLVAELRDAISLLEQQLDSVELAGPANEDRGQIAESYGVAARLRSTLARALEEVWRYTPIPSSAPDSCLCSDKSVCALPEHILEGLLEIAPL